MDCDQPIPFCGAEFAHIREQLAEIRAATCGSPDNPAANPGLKIRVDRLEQSEARRSRGLWACAAAIIALAVQEIGRVFVQR